MNPHIYDWAAKHGVTHSALEELRQVFGLAAAAMALPALPAQVVTEAGVQSHVRLAAARAGLLVWRNNVGAMEDKDGRVVRFGLCNDSAAVNRHVKSSDLVGIMPGGRFWARECKPAGWHYTGTEREQAQLRYIELVSSMGGDAAFTTGKI